MKLLSILFIYCIFYLSLYNNLEISFDNTVDCSIEQCNFNNETLWLGGVIPGINDTAIIDYSNSTFNGGDSGDSDLQQIYIPPNVYIQLSNLIISGPDLSFIINNGVLVVSGFTNLTNSNITLTSTLSNSTQFANLIMIDSFLSIDSINSDTNYITVNGTSLSNIQLNSGNFTFTDVDSPLFQVGTLDTYENTLITLTGNIDIESITSLGIVSIVDTCTLKFGPSDDNLIEIYSLIGTFSMTSQMDFYDDTIINSFEIIQTSNISFSQITFHSSVEINYSLGLNNTIITIPEDSTFQQNSTLDLGMSGGLIIYGDADISKNTTVGDVGIAIKPQGSVTSSSITINGDVDIHDAKLNSNSTTFNGDIYQDSGVFNLLGSVQINGDFTQSDSTTLILTNILNNQTTPTLQISGVATISGILSVSIKNEFKQNFSSLLISASRIEGDFTQKQILTFGSNKTPIFKVQTSKDGKSQEIWLSFATASDTPKQKLPAWLTALIVVGSLCSIFVIFLAIISVYRLIKKRSNMGYAMIE